MRMTDRAERRHSSHLPGGEDPEEPAPPRRAGKAQRPSAAALPGAGILLLEPGNHADGQCRVHPHSCSKHPARMLTCQG